MTKTYSKTFAKNVKAYTKAKRISIGEIESYVGISRGYISRIINGKSGIILDVAYQISHALGVSLAFLLDENLLSNLKTEKIKTEIRKKEAEIEELRRSIGA